MNFQAIIKQITLEVADRQISVAAMARELGLPQRTLANVLDGDRGIGGRTLTRIMQARPEWWSLLNNNHNAGHPSSRERS